MSHHNSGTTAIISTGSSGSRHRKNSASKDDHHRYACLPTFDFLSASPFAELPSTFQTLNSADSVATSSTAPSDTTIYPKRRYSAEHQAFAQAWKRHCDPEGSYRSAVHSVTTCDYNWERTAVWGQKSGNRDNEQRGLKSSKSDSHLHQRLRPHPPRPAQPLEEYSLGSGNPYASPE